jgi:N-acyl-D-aspartate/D-glutamate deacylase
LTREATPAEAGEIVHSLERSLADGALGYGLGIEYTPGASRSEIYDIFKSAAKLDVPVFVHVRRRTPDGAAGAGIAAAQEVIADASATGASLQLVHVHSTGLRDTPVILDMIGNAVRQGADITTEAYPYTAGSTLIGSEFFADGWQERARIGYSDLQWPQTGERLTEESFNRLRKEQPTAAVIIHMIPADVVDAAITNPLVMIASDGMAWHTNGEHPRGAGTYSRVLGRYVRERGLLTLPDAIAKMTIMPAKRLEGIAPAMRRKGRIQAGMDADITIFDPDTVIDRATFANPMQPARGIKYVLVGGTLIVKDEQIVPGALPGQPIKSRYASQDAGDQAAPE